MANAYAKLADIIEKHPKKVILVWIVALLLAVPIGVQTFTSDALIYDMTGMVDNSYDSVKGMEIIADKEYFSGGMEVPDVMVVLEGKDALDLTKVGGFASELTAKLTEKYGDGSVATVMGSFEKNSEGVSVLTVTYPASVRVADEIENTRSIIASIDGYDFNKYVTGSSAIGHDTEAGAMKDVQRIDPFTILLVLILIGLFFRSLVSAAVPPMVIGVAYGMTLSFIYLLSLFMGIYYITGTIVLIAMLGAGCDYCIFILARYREERKKGLEHMAALKESVIWAGESITTSGISVVIGFGAMSLCTFSMISTMGLVLAVGVVFALLAALTLIPSILALAGEKLFIPTKMSDFEPGSKVMSGWYGKVSRLGERYFKSSADHAVKYAVPIVLAAILITVPLAYVAVNNEGSYDMISVMPDGEAKEGVDLIVDYADGGLIMPTYILFEKDGTPMYNDVPIPDETLAATLAPMGLNTMRVWTDEGKAYAMSNTLFTAELLKADENISYAIGLFAFEAYLVTDYTTAKAMISTLPTLYSEQLLPAVTMLEAAGVPWTITAGIIEYQINSMLGTTSNVVDNVQYIKMTMVVADEPMAKVSMDSISVALDEAKKLKESALFGGLYTDIIVTGSVVAIYDMSKVVTEEFSYIEMIVVVLIFLLLFFVMRSYLTPIRAIITIVMSIAWTLGLTFLLFEGLLGVPVTFMLPIILFVICLGLGMDYDILLTTRIKENVMKGMSNDDAIKEAIRKSGSVITICGLIMAGAFGTMMLSTSPMLQEIGFGLCFAIAVDALVIRTYVVPAAMHLMGKWNWIGPKWMAHDGEGMTKKVAGSFGIVAGIFFLILIAIAYFKSGATDLLAMSLESLVNSTDGIVSKSAYAGTILAALMTFFFGYGVTASQKGMAKVAGILAIVSAVLILGAGYFSIPGVSAGDLWAIAFGFTLIPVLLLAIHAGLKKHMAVAGSIMVVVLAGLAAIYVGVPASMALALTAMGGIILGGLAARN